MNNTYLLSQLTVEEKMLLNTELANRKKSSTALWLLWLFFGGLGGHRYYMGRKGSAIAMTLIVVLSFFFLGFITLIWAIIDAFSLNKWLQEDQEMIENEIAQRILSSRNANIQQNPNPQQYQQQNPNPEYQQQNSNQPNSPENQVDQITPPDNQ